MKKTFTQFALLVLFAFGLVLPGKAQSNCTPDDMMSASSNYPEVWKKGCVGVPYEETIYFSFPKDTVVVVSITFDSYEVVSHTLPSWMSYDCNVSSCKWTPTNTTNNTDQIYGCMTVSGTPDAPFNGTVTITIEGCGQTFIGTQCGDDTQDFTLIIEDTTNVGFSTTVNQTTVDFMDASSGGPAPLSYNWTFGDGNASSLQNPTHTYASAGTYTVCFTRTDMCGDYSICKDVEITTTNVDPTRELSEWTVAPNPSEDQMWVEGILLRQESVELSLLTLHGKQLWSSTGEPNDLHFKAPVDLSGLASGVYLLEIRAGDNRTVKRIQRL